MVAASQAPNFEATLRESRAEDSIVAPTEGSEQATIVPSEAGNTEADEAQFQWVEENYNGFDWARFPLHCKPPTTLSSRASWIYGYGYRLALRSNVSEITWVCHYCYKHKFTLLGRGVHKVN